MRIRIGRLPRAAVGAILKNEGPYILEWVAFHRVLGFTRFFLADNNSDDGTTELLRALQHVGIIDHIPFPHVDGTAPQLPAYAEILSRFGPQVDWIAFIDGDEFLMPAGDLRSIRELLTTMEADVGAVAANWAIYGSSFSRVATEGLVIERFRRRGKEQLTANHHYKTIIRPKAALVPEPNPHHFRIREGYRLVHADGQLVTPHEIHGDGLSTEIRWQPLRVNHYVIKSRAEFDRKKQPRGRASVWDRRRNAGFFASHDKNDVDDPPPDWLIEATRAEMERIRRSLTAAGCPEALVRLDETILTLTPLMYPSDNQNWRGVVERIVVSEGTVTVKGWALTDEYKSPASFSVMLDDRPVENVTIKRPRRPDVAEMFEGSELRSGFVLSFSLSGLPEECRASKALKVVAEDGEHSVGLSSDAVWPPAGL